MFCSVKIFIGSLLFSIFFIVWLCGLAIIGLPFLFTPRSMTIRLVKFWGRGVLKALKLFCTIDYQLEGLEHLPKAPFIIAAKHQSTFETIALYTLLDDVVVIIKRELLLIPFYGWYVAKTRMIPIDRGNGVVALRKMLKRADESKSKQQIILVFPEGTRTKPGAKPQYKGGVAALYHHLDVPVVPLSLNSGLFWGKRQFMKPPGTIYLRFHPAIAPHLAKQEFTAKLENVIETGTNSLYTRRHGAKSD